MSSEVSIKKNSLAHMAHSSWLYIFILAEDCYKLKYWYSDIAMST